MDEQIFDAVPMIAKQPSTYINYYEWLRFNELTRGTIRIFNGTEAYNVKLWMNELAALEADDRIKEINIELMSGGGPVYSALALYDSIVRAAKTKPVKITVNGYAASAASMIILQAGTTRAAREHARFLLHEPRRSVFFSTETESDMVDATEEMTTVKKSIIKILADRCDKTEAEVKDTFNRKEKWMSAEQAKDWGLIDEIVA